MQKLDANPEDDQSPSNIALELFYDGGCPLCSREISILRRLDRQQGISIIDLYDQNFDQRSVDRDLSTLMRRIHGRRPSGEWVEGVDVFRQIYLVLGYRWLVYLSSLPLVRNVLDIGYEIFARWRFKKRCADGACKASPTFGS